MTSDPSIYIMDQLDLTISNFMDNSIGFKRVKDTLQHIVLLLACAEGNYVNQWPSQNLKKITHIKWRLLDQAVIPFS